MRNKLYIIIAMFALFALLISGGGGSVSADTYGDTSLTVLSITPTPGSTVAANAYSDVIIKFDRPVTRKYYNSPIDADTRPKAGMVWYTDMYKTEPDPNDASIWYITPPWIEPASGSIPVAWPAGTYTLTLNQNDFVGEDGSKLTATQTHTFTVQAKEPELIASQPIGEVSAEIGKGFGGNGTSGFLDFYKNCVFPAAYFDVPVDYADVSQITMTVTTPTGTKTYVAGEDWHIGDTPYKTERINRMTIKEVFTNLSVFGPSMSGELRFDFGPGAVQMKGSDVTNSQSYSFSFTVNTQKTEGSVNPGPQVPTVTPVVITDPKQKWQRDERIDQIAPGGDSIIVVSERSTLKSIDRLTGNLQWTFEGEGIIGRPVVDPTDSTVYVTYSTEYPNCENFYIVALNPGDGSVKWQRPIPITQSIYANSNQLPSLAVADDGVLMLVNGTIGGFGSSAGGNVLQKFDKNGNIVAAKDLSMLGGDDWRATDFLVAANQDTIMAVGFDAIMTMRHDMTVVSTVDVAPEITSLIRYPLAVSADQNGLYALVSRDNVNKDTVMLYAFDSSGNYAWKANTKTIQEFVIPTSSRIWVGSNGYDRDTGIVTATAPGTVVGAVDDDTLIICRSDALWYHSVSGATADQKITDIKVEYPVIHGSIYAASKNTLFKIEDGTPEPPPEPEPISLTVTPAAATINVGDTQQYTAILGYSDDSTQDVTTTSTWTTDDTGVATISSPGLATGISPGAVKVQAVYGSLTGTADLRVTSNGSGGGGGGGGGSNPTPDPEPAPPIENLPDGTLIDRMPGYIPMGLPVKIDNPGKEIILDIATIKPEYADKMWYKDRHPTVYYWHDQSKHWVALASYPVGNAGGHPTGVKAVLDGDYSGWFTVFGVIKPDFIDTGDHWAEQAANRMNGLGFLEGYPGSDDGLSRPVGLERNVTRNEFISVTTRILGMNPGEKMYDIITPISSVEADSILSQFSDSVDAWAKLNVAAAVKAGLVSGSDNEFQGDQPITRIEAAAVVSRALKKLPGYQAIDLSKFTDAKDVPGWAKAAVADGVLTGDGGKLCPNEYITRGESLTVLLRLLRGLGW